MIQNFLRDTVETYPDPELDVNPSEMVLTQELQVLKERKIWKEPLSSFRCFGFVFKNSILTSCLVDIELILYNIILAMYVLCM